MIIGIDFSINSTALTIKTNSTYQSFSFVPNYTKGKKAFKIHEALDSVFIVGYEKLNSSSDSVQDQSNKLKSAENLANAIISTLEKIPNEDLKEIRIEGFSYGSKGNSFIDLIVFNTYLKVKLIDKFGHIIRVIPPKTLKKAYTGNGNATKCDMLKKYINKENTQLRESINKLEIIKEGEFTIPKPIDDVIDSIALTEID